jgi:hypothetical protein
MRDARILFVGFLSIAAAVSAQEREDFSGRVTPRCEMAGLVAIPPPGWFAVPFENPPAGNRGCVMILTNRNEEPVGILRIRSLAAPALKEGGGPFEALFISEIESVETMGYAIVDEKPLFQRNDVPIKGPGMRDARGLGLAARIEGNSVPQEVHLLMFRGDHAEYIVTLMTPAKSYDAKLWERNTEDFGTLIRTLQAPK